MLFLFSFHHLSFGKPAIPITLLCLQIEWCQCCVIIHAVIQIRLQHPAVKQFRTERTTLIELVVSRTVSTQLKNIRYIYILVKLDHIAPGIGVNINKNI